MTTSTYTPDNLLAGNFPTVMGYLQIPDSTLKRGTVITSDGEAMETGGEPYGVLAEDADASESAVMAPVYLTGEFTKRHLILADDAELASEDIAALRAISIFVKGSVLPVTN